MNKKYKLIINKKQALIIILALEIYYRLCAGQWTTAFDMIFRYIFSKKHPYRNFYKLMDEKFDIKEKMKYDTYRGTFYQAILALKKHITGLEPNESWGIGHSDMEKKATQAYDIEEVIRECVYGKKKIVHWDKEMELPKMLEVKNECS